MANIQVDDILAGTPAVQCKTKVRAPSAPTTRDPPARFLTRLANYGIPRSRADCVHARPEERGALHHGRPAPRGYVRRALQLLARLPRVPPGHAQHAASGDAQHQADVRGAFGHQGTGDPHGNAQGGQARLDGGWSRGDDPHRLHPTRRRAQHRHELQEAAQRRRAGRGGEPVFPPQISRLVNQNLSIRPV